MRTLAVLLVSVVASWGCASAPSDPDRYDIDMARVNAVEQAAARAGVRVYWINAPRRTSKPTNG